MSLPTLDAHGVTKSTYTTGGVGGVSWAFTRVSNTNVISSSTFTTLATYIGYERSRRTQGAATMNTSTPINSTDYNQLRDALAVAGQGSNTFYYDYGGGNGGIDPPNTYTNGGVGAPWVPGAVSNSNLVTASQLNDMMYALEQAAAVCLCNCNYCTCNCNYCTCNCNYSCTCNCNY